MVNAAVQYRNALKRKLCCTTAVKARLLRQFDAMIAAFLEQRGDCTADDLTAAFGPVEEMAATLMAQVTAHERTQYRKAVLLQKSLAAMFAVILAALTIYTFFFKEVGLTYEGEFYIIDEETASYYNLRNEGELL